jgi:SAM-dependent methyltransferase
MTEDKRAPHITVAVIALGVVLSTGLGLVAGSARHTIAWSLTFAAVGLADYAAVELYFALRTPKRPIELVFGQRALKRRYSKMRRTRGATHIQAVWSAGYAATDLYFEGERRFLSKSSRRRLEIERLVDSKVLDNSQLVSGLRDLVTRYAARFTVWETTSPEFECFVCRYEARNEVYVKALFVINDTDLPAPEMGIYIDPERDPSVKSLAFAIQHWFDRLPRHTALASELNQPATDSTTVSAGWFAERSATWWLRVRLRGRWLLRVTRELPSAAKSAFRSGQFLVNITTVVGVAGIITGVYLSNTDQRALWVYEGVLLLLAFWFTATAFVMLLEPRPSVDLLEGERDLRQRYEEMRRTPGAYLIKAIWSARYPDAERSVAREKRDLADAPDVRIQRLVDPAIMETHLSRAALVELERDYPNLELGETISPELECLLCHYESEGASRLKSLLVVNDSAGGGPKLGVYVDPASGPALRAVPVAIERWFDRLPNHPLVQGDAPETIWDYGARSYDDVVTKSNYPFLREFLDAEAALLEDAVRAVAEDGPVSVVEIGSGTGRAQLHLAQSYELMRSVRVLLGIDNSRAMVRVAEENVQDAELAAAIERKLVFLPMDARSLGTYLTAGDIRMDRLTRDFAGRPRMQNIVRSDYRHSRRVLCCLLNTLGVVRSSMREAIVRAVGAAAVPGDTLIVSVFAGEMFEAEARGLYAAIPEIVGTTNLGGDAFDRDLCEFQIRPGGGGNSYYSHWFRELEVLDLLEAQGWHIATHDRMGERGHFVVAVRL